jgi:hypothetical protein
MIRTFPGTPGDARFDRKSFLFNGISLRWNLASMESRADRKSRLDGISLRGNPPSINGFVVPAKAATQRHCLAPKRATNRAGASMRARIFADPLRKC